MNEYPAFIRTYVPLLVGLIVSVAASHGLVIPGVVASGLAEVIGFVAGAVYYAVIRLLERKWPWLGVLLGYEGAPTYEPRHAAVADGEATITPESDG